jgi:hypothetical protein
MNTKSWSCLAAVLYLGVMCCSGDDAEVQSVGGMGDDGGRDDGGRSGTGGRSGSTGGGGGRTGEGGTTGSGVNSDDAGPECEERGCGAHGSCESGACVCDVMYAGDACESCAAGFVRSDDGERCVADLICAPGAELCVDSWGTRASEAVVGMAIDAEGGVLAVGTTSRDRAESDFMISKRGAKRSESWTLKWGSPETDEAGGVLVDGGGIFVAGTTNGSLGDSHLGLNDAVLMRLDLGGALEWSVQWGTAIDDRVASMARATDGALLVLGETAGDLARPNPDPTFTDLFLTKLSTEGEELWSVQWGAVENDVPIAVAAAPEGGAFVVGSTWGVVDAAEHYGGSDAFCSKVSAEGEVEWSLQWSDVHDEEAYAVVALPSGEALVISEAGALIDEATGARGGVHVRIIDAEGNVASEYAFGSSNDLGLAVELAHDGAFYVAGRRDGGDFFVSERASDGAELWSEQWDSGGRDIVSAIALTQDRLYAAGTTDGMDPVGDPVVVSFLLD